ncbi:MAG TPA: hypothetical protein VK689_15745, partial [Armatimonadota bacterium]|nr:hypothetical protein [Armatimonadota bacterium]
MMERPDKQAAADQVLTQLVPFLEHLREQGLSVGVDDYLRVHVLVQRLETEAAFEETESEAAEGLPPRLRSFLRPLFATTAAEQTKFDRAFASFRTRIALSDSVPPGARVDPTAREAERRQELAWRWKEVAEEKRRRQETELWEQSELRRKQAQQQAVRRRRKLVGALFIALLLFLLIPIGLLWFMRGNYHKSLERTIDFGTVKAKGAAFPTSEQPLFLNGSEQLPRAVRRYLAPRLRLAPGSSPVFQLTKGIAPGAYVLRFQPRQPTAYRARLRLDSLNPFDRLPEFQAEVTGDAILPGPAYHLTPEKKVDFGLHAVGATKRAPSVQLTLQQDAGAPFQPDALPRIEGTGAEHFHFVPRDLTQSFRAKRARHPFQVVFEPQPGAVGVLEAEVVYRSGERSSDPSNVVELTGQVPAIGQEVATATLTVEGEAIPGTRLPVRRPWWVAALAALLLLLPGLLLVRRLIGGWSRKEPPANPPFEWPLETDRGFTPFSASELGDTAALLAPPTRRQDPPGVFDAPASVRAAASAAGFARPRFRPHTGQPAGYVALIHRPSAEDLAAAYFRSMLRQLQRRGVPLELFYYRGNSIPTCWDEKGHAYPLSRIRKEYADRRLLIFGPADCLIDEGELKRWTGGSHPPAIFTLSSRPLTHIWDMPFPQFPGRLSGLRDAERRLPGAAETKPATAACAPEPPLPSEVLGARETAERLEHGYFRDDPRLFHWLCACARLPQVSWDLVLLFGLEVEAQGTTNRQSQARELEGGEPGEASFQKQANGRLVTEENLLRLLRLEWLREARIPQELRLELQRRLQTHRDLDAAIRQLLIRLLSRPPLPPAGSTASARLELELSVQAWID